jgi:hypothetical protein
MALDQAPNGRQASRASSYASRPRTNETLYAYAHFPGESTKYVLQPGDRHRVGEGQGLRSMAGVASRVVRPASNRPRRGSGRMGHVPTPVLISTPGIPAR